MAAWYLVRQSMEPLELTGWLAMTWHSLLLLTLDWFSVGWLMVVWCSLGHL